MHVSVVPTTPGNPLVLYTGAQTVTGGLPVTASGRTLTFPLVGEYLVLTNIGGTVIGNASPTVAGTATSADLLGFAFDDGMATALCYAYRVQVNNPGATFIVDVSSSIATCDLVDVRISYYAYLNA